MYTPIVGTLGYVLSPDGRRVLLIHRNARASDHHFGKYNGLGGKMRPDEDVLACLGRELREEAGIRPVAVRLRGVINWSGFGDAGEDWLGFVFLVHRFAGLVRERCAEGTLAWHPLDALERLPLWEGDRHFLPLVFDADPRVFYGHMPYRHGRPLGFTYHRC